MTITGYKEKIFGMNVQNENFYVIRNKENYMFVDESGDETMDILPNGIEVIEVPKIIYVILMNHSCLI